MFFGKKLLLISAGVIAVWMVFGVLIYHSTSLKFFNSEENDILGKTKDKNQDICKEKSYFGFWQKLNIRKDILEDIKAKVSEVKVQSNFTTIQDSKVHYLWVKPKLPKKLFVLLLHGHSFTSDVWKKIQTLQTLAAFGYTAFAIDLPGYGSSPEIKNIDRVKFLNSTIAALKLDNLVLISPSMSGSYSLPYLVQYASKLTGFVPVSPVHTDALLKEVCNDSVVTDAEFDEDCKDVMPFVKDKVPALSCLKVPTLVVYGELDKSRSSGRLCRLPHSRGAQIPHGEHAAYLSNPKLWHKFLYHFLEALSQSLLCDK